MRLPEKFGPASLLAPAIVPLLVLAVIGNSGEGMGRLNALTIFLIAFVSYAGFFAFGYPLAKALDERSTLSISTMLLSGLQRGAIVGAILGLVVGGLLSSFSAPSLILLFSLGGLVAFGGLGALVAFLFGVLSSVLAPKDP